LESQEPWHAPGDAATLFRRVLERALKLAATARVQVRQGQVGHLVRQPAAADFGAQLIKTRGR
jgi:hypothetical protein